MNKIKIIQETGINETRRKVFFNANLILDFVYIAWVSGTGSDDLKYNYKDEQLEMYEKHYISQDDFYDLFMETEDSLNSESFEVEFEVFYQ